MDVIYEASAIMSEAEEQVGGCWMRTRGLEAARVRGLGRGWSANGLWCLLKVGSRV